VQNRDQSCFRRRVPMYIGAGTLVVILLIVLIVYVVRRA
jgi:Tfp pilus assembly protein PilN